MLAYVLALVLLFIPAQNTVSELYVTSGKMYVPKGDKKTYGPAKSLTRKQKIQQGIIIEDKMTLCRLKKRVKTKSGEEVCIYEGGNKTFEMAIEKNCPRSYMCKYNPHGEEPSIDSVVDSLNEAMK
jgi:leucyl-tRNA synthetase